MNKILLILTGVLFLNLTSCEETSLKNEASVEGTWVFKEFFLGDAILSGCGWESEEARTMTLVIELEEGKYKISGNAPVNSYFGNMLLLSFDNENNKGKVEIPPIASTKMAGPEPLMQCETQYFELLGSSTDIGLISNDVLHLGRFRTPESNPRDGGTYLVFERAKGE